MAPWISGFIICIMTGKFSAIVSSKIVSSPMVSSWTPITHILDLLKLPYHSLTRCSIKKHFFFFTVSFILGIFNCSGFMLPNLFFFFPAVSNLL